MTRSRNGGAEPAMRPPAFLTLALVAGLSLAPSVAAARPQTCRVDKAHYAALKTGMSFDRVRGVIGCPGRRVSHLSVGRIHRTTYSWPARGTYGASITLTFRNHRLTDKAQLGLR